MPSLFDPGLQPERTELAWRRTALALGLGSLISMRLLPAALGDATWALAGVAGLAVTGFLWMFARRRYRAVNAALAEGGDRARLPGASALALLALTIVAFGAAGLGIVLVVALGT